MKTSDFDYYLPEELIAQTPLKDRTSSRLLVLNKNDGAIEHLKFHNIIDFLNENDVLVLNDTKVLPSRIYGNKVDTNAYIELLLLKEKQENVWEALVRPARRVHVGTVISFNNGALKAECISCGEDGMREFKMIYDGIFLEILEEIGTMPLPPYIHEKLEDGSRYQTVYAMHQGSAAAPTAGLHFTDELLKKLEEKGVEIANVTLHVGVGTFIQVKVEIVEAHNMHSEYFFIYQEDVDKINIVK